MGVLSSAWCPGGRTTAKPFCNEARDTPLGQSNHTDRNTKRESNGTRWPSALLKPLWRRVRPQNRRPDALRSTSELHSRPCHCPPSHTKQKCVLHAAQMMKRWLRWTWSLLTPIPPHGSLTNIEMREPEPDREKTTHQRCIHSELMSFVWDGLTV